MAYSSIVKPGDYFNTKLYTGTGSSNALTGVGFQPDWVWLKERAGAGGHNIFDAVRGVTKVIYSNGTNAESTEAQALTTFGTDGFTLGTNTNVNESGMSMVGWNWKANGAGSANTDGTINSTVSVNTTSGFSIVSYTGTGSAGTVGHGLGSTPAMIIVKNRSETYAWNCYHQSLGATKYILLNSTDTSATGTTWNDTAPTSSVFSIGSTSGVNKNTNNFIAYCFAEKTGYSKFSSYTGNGNANGTFVYTGFKPAWVMIKPTTVAQNWQIHDTKRDGYNPNNDNLSSNNSNSEADNKFIDIVSNGFKLRRSDVLNVSGDPYIYMAFAEEPLVANSGNGVPATAR